jgi:ribosome-binding factor A
MPSRRQQQVADAIQKEVSVLIQRELKDPRLGFVTVTRAEVSPDLHHAKIFVSVLGSPEEQQATLKVLESAAGFLRHELGARLSMRYIPALQFRTDVSIAHSDRIARLLHELESDGSPAAPAAAEPSADGSSSQGEKEE